jgi:transposase
MKIVDTKAIAGRRRRTYSPDFKREIVMACRKAGASVAGVALSHGINANVVHRWLREVAGASRALPSPAFVPVAFDLPAAPEAKTAAPSKAEIRIEVERGQSRVVVTWPVCAAAECAAWLAEWLA